jgi:phosphonate transport system substrate-binding protein
LVIAGAIVSLAAAVVIGGALPHRANRTSEIRMAVTPGNPVLFGQVFTPVAEFIARESHLQVRAVIPASYEDAVDGLVKGRYQMAILSPEPYVQAKRRMPSLVLLGGRRYSGKVPYRSLVIARKSGDTPVTLESLRGSSFCFVDQHSTSGYRVPLALLRRAGWKIPEDVGTPRFSGDHFRVMSDILAGHCVAGAVSSMEFADAHRQALDTSLLAVVLESDPLPPMAVVANPNLDPEAIEALRRAILEAPVVASTVQQLNVSEELGSFGKLGDSDFDIIREIDRQQDL